MATPPPFDFTNFASQLQSVIAKAITDGLKRVDTSGLKSSMSRVFDDLDVEEKLSTPLDKFRKKIEDLRKIRAAGGREALDQANQQSSLQEDFYKELRANVTQENISNKLSLADRLKAYKEAKAQAAVQAAALMQNLKLEAARNDIQQQYIQNLDQLKGKLNKIKAIMTDPTLRKTVIATEGINLLIKGIKSLGDEYKKFRDEGQTGTQALDSTFKSLTVSSVLFGTKTGDALKVTQNAVGDLNAVSKDTADKMGMLALITGASAESVGKLQANLQQIPGQTEASAAQTSKFAANLARAANVAPGKVLETMSNSSEEIAKFSADGGRNFARAAVGAQKMGVEVSKIAQAAEGLLDFENSINKQMEASVLLGKEINLDSAREKALQGDLLGASQDMLKNIGGEAEFNRMNLIQKKALAETMGMSVADLGKMVKNQDKFNDAQKEAIANGATMDEVMALGGGFLEKWGGGLKDLGIGLLQAIPTMLVYTTNLSILTTTRQAAAAAQGREIVAENTSMLTRLKSIGIWIAQKAAMIALAPVYLALRVAKIAWNGILAIGNGLQLKSIGLYIKEKAQIALSTAAKWLNVGANTAVATSSAPAATGIMTIAQAASAGAIGMLAFGAAILMIGGGIAIAALGLAQLVQSFKGLTGGEMLGALTAIVVVMGGFVAIMYAMIPAIGALGAVGSVVAIPLLALGAAFLMMGAGIGIAAYGLSTLVSSLKDVPFENLIALPIALMDIAGGLASIALTGLAALPVIGALIGLAAVAPALSKLGDVLGGGGGASKEDDPLLAEIKGLREDLKKPVPINIDGRKLSDFLRLATNTTAFT